MNSNNKLRKIPKIKFGYRIGAVSRMTGLPDHLIRVWEKRYGTVTPTRQAGNQRLYSQEDVLKLILLKKLIRVGHAISSIAGYNLDELKNCAKMDLENLNALVKMHKIHAIVVGENAKAEFRNLGPESAVVVDKYCTKLEELDSTPSAKAVDLLVIEQHEIMEVVGLDLLRAFQQVKPRLMVVIYNKATNEAVKTLSNDQIILYRGNINLLVLQRMILQQLRADMGFQNLVTAAVPDSLSNDQQLKLHGSKLVNCECQGQISEILALLGQFETFVKGCNIRSPSNAQTYMEIYELTCWAKEMMEEALTNFAEIECLKI